MNPNNIEPGIFDSNILGTSMPYAKVLPKYLALESQTMDELRDTLWGDGTKNIEGFEDVPPYDYRPLREGRSSDRQMAVGLSRFGFF